MKRILVANRGEIVCRIVRTLRRMGLTALAVYSDADRNARHVRVAEEAYHLGASPAAESYLDGTRLIELARRVGADAIHPGYGFLSENAAFAQACVDAGLIFIGPPAAAIRAMGSKSAAKAAMAAEGVPVAPGYHGDDQSLARLRAEAERVGFPLIIKASAGGGGKGMQVVRAATEVESAIASAQRLARTAFADDRLLLERYFPSARHVEVQVFADGHGRVTTLLDRDCSVQRRHQKILEEAPAPGLRADVRAAMSAASITAARAVNYVGAGTIEFLLDEEQNFYFMEMNTRLQVEHPVTELVTGIDLVEWQIRVARGEPLPETFGLGAARGAAIEARLYAEDPARDYLPSVGRIEHLRWPSERPGLRLDIGVDAGDEVSSFYDPMLGKVIAWGETRSEALDTLAQALGDLQIVGVDTNLALLSSVVGDEVFRDTAVATDYLARRGPRLAFGGPAASHHDAVLLALWCATRRREPGALWQGTTGWRLGSAPLTRWRLDTETVAVEAVGQNAFVVRTPAAETAVLLIARGDDGLDVELEGRRVHATIVESGVHLHLFTERRHVALRLWSTEDALDVETSSAQGSLLTPLPGTVVALHVTAGQRVARGAPLVTVEAMKMEHTLSAPQEGVVERVLVSVADRVAAGAVLVAMVPAPIAGD